MIRPPTLRELFVLYALLFAYTYGCARFTISGGMPGFVVPIRDAPARHSDGGQPEDASR